MILHQKTLEDLGVDSEKLSRQSNKLVWVQCDYCSECRTVMYYRVVNARKYIPKDTCGSTSCTNLKRTEATLLKYGAENVSQVREIKEAREATFKERFGGHPAKSEEIKQKIQASNMKKYGVPHSGQAPEIQEKIEKSNLLKFGFKSSLSSPEVKEKIRQTCKENYGTDHALSSLEVQERVHNTRLEKNLTRTHDGKIFRVLCEEWGIPYSTWCAWISKYGLDEALVRARGGKTLTSIESKVHTFLTGLGVQFQVRKKLGSYFPDFLIEESKLIIECDGLYWHSDLVQEDSEYHRKKLLAYESLGYRALFFREDEINNRFSVVSSIVKNHLRLNQSKIFARKCTVKVVDKGQAKNFFDENHLMGRGKGVTFGLFHEGVLVSAMQVLHIKDKLEISRFSSLPETTVVGGFSKLVKYAQDYFGVSTVHTFIDRRYGRGNYLPSLGFKNLREHCSFRWVDLKSSSTFHRMKYSGSSGYEKGMVKIWDCGQGSWELRK